MCEIKSTVLGWILGSSIFLSSVACSGGSGPSGSVSPSDSLSRADSVRIADSLRVLDSIRVADSLARAHPPPPGSPPPVSHTGIAFGVWSLWDPVAIKGGAAPFTASANYTDFYVILHQIAAARALNHRLLLQMTDHTPESYATDGKFDLVKWKREMDDYRLPIIQTAIAEGVADGTIMGNSVLDEPKRAVWGNNLDKAMIDEMCAYVKGIFPTLPVGVVVVHWWRPSEHYRVCDFIVSQYGWSQPPHGWGTPGGHGDVIGWRDAALEQARQDGIAIAFSINLLNGGEELEDCSSSRTGGPGTYPKHCQMTPKQVSDFGLALATAGCAMFTWRYDASFMSNAANVQALDAIAAATAAHAPRSCRRPP
jgi:hypothetical protein